MESEGAGFEEGGIVDVDDGPKEMVGKAANALPSGRRALEGRIL